MRPIVYVAGAFRAPTHWDILKNVRLAEDASLELWKAGFAVITPHLNSINFQHTCPDDYFGDGYLEILRKCDLAYFLPNYERSAGSMIELDCCVHENIPTTFDLQAARTWIENWRLRRQTKAGHHIQLEPEGQIAVVNGTTRDTMHYTFVDPLIEHLGEFDIAGGMVGFDDDWWHPVVEVEVE